MTSLECSMCVSSSGLATVISSMSERSWTCRRLRRDSLSIDIAGHFQVNANLLRSNWRMRYWWKHLLMSNLANILQF